MTVAAPLNLESPPCQESPELQLWRQVLLLAITDCRGPSVGVKPHDKRSAQQRAYAWIFSAREHPGSFKWCCEVLGVDPRAVHKQVLLQQPPTHRSLSNKDVKICRSALPTHCLNCTAAQNGLLKKQWQSRNRVTRRPEVKLRMSDLYPPTRFAKTYGRANKNLEVMAERKGEA
jgi:hypothetical protein